MIRILSNNCCIDILLARAGPCENVNIQKPFQMSSPGQQIAYNKLLSYGKSKVSSKETIKLQSNPILLSGICQIIGHDPDWRWGL